jgi:hypothetical protein
LAAAIPQRPGGRDDPGAGRAAARSCWRCHTPIRPVLGVELPAPTEAHPDGFVGIDLCAETVAATVPAEELLDAGAGAIRWRTTRVMSDGYWANTCPSCDATIGSFPLVHEALPELAAEGLTPQDLPGLHAEVPASAFAHNPWDEEDDDEPMVPGVKDQPPAPRGAAPASTPEAGPPRRDGFRERVVSAWRRSVGR